MENSFEEARKHYEQQREQERKKLIEYLDSYAPFSDSGLIVVARGRSGNGNRNYTSGGHITPFDLTNWKWVECKYPDGEFNALVSLNMPDNDLNSGNPHSLYDRLGIIATYKAGSNYHKHSIWTDIDLPLNETAMKKIAKIIITQFDFYNKLNH